MEGKNSNITFAQPLLPLLTDNIGSGLDPTDVHIQPLSSSDLITTDVITVTITTSFYTSLFISSYSPSLSPSSTSTSKGNNVDLLFIFVILTIGLGLLIAIALALLFCVCFCQIRTSNITVVAKNRKNDSKVEEMTLRYPIGTFEVVRPNIETNAIDFPQISTSDITQPQELLAYDIPTSFLPLPPPQTRITPSNSIRVSAFQPITNSDEDHNTLNVVSSDRQDEAISDYVEPIDTLNPYADHQSSNTSSNDTDNENVTADPPPPPPRNHYKMDKSCSSGSDFPDYDHVYTEALEPSMLGGERSPFQNRNEGLPYGHIYDMSRKSKRIHRLFCISPQNIRAIQELGRGHFGKVYLAATTGVSLKDLKLSDDNDKTRSLLVAVKQLKPTADTNLRDAFQKEVKFMSRLHHANVARVLAICSTSTPFIMMEYMENGDLNEFLRKQELKPDTVSTLNENEVTPMILLYIAVQIASGMKYLATKKFVHRDLATRNCLVGRDFVTKISDFGMSRNIYESAYYLVGGQLILPIRWMAAETFYGKFSVKSDAWSFGVTVWELFTLCRDMPYADLIDDEVIADALRGESREILTKPEACPHEVYSVMLRCFVHQANIRADFEELYSRLFVVYSTLGQQTVELPQN